jgi:hypothetical protein
MFSQNGTHFTLPVRCTSYGTGWGGVGGSRHDSLNFTRTRMPSSSRPTNKAVNLSRTWVEVCLGNARNKVSKIISFRRTYHFCLLYVASWQVKLLMSVRITKIITTMLLRSVRCPFVFLVTPYYCHVYEVFAWLIWRDSDWLRAGRVRGRSSSLGSVKNFLFSTSSRPALGSTQPPIQWEQGTHSLGVKRPERETNQTSS